MLAFPSFFNLSAIFSFWLGLCSSKTYSRGTSLEIDRIIYYWSSLSHGVLRVIMEFTILKWYTFKGSGSTVEASDFIQEIINKSFRFHSTELLIYLSNYYCFCLNLLKKLIIKLSFIILQNWLRIISCFTFPLNLG